jgi:S-formylglutathione hydrolase FrmB
MSSRPVIALWGALALLAPASCGDDASAPADGGDGDAEAPADGEDGGPQRIGSLRADPAFLGMLAGETRTVRIWVEHPPDAPITLSVAAEPSGVVDVPATAGVDAGAWSVDIEVEASAVGTTTVTVSYEARQATVAVDVATPDLACSGSAAGSLAPGGAVEATGGGLAGARIAMPPDLSLPTLEVTVSCADDIVPADHTPIGPAVRVEPLRRFARELGLALPVKAGLVPERVKLGDLRVFYADGRGAPRAVPFASPWLDGAAGGSTFRFATPRTGTFQVAYETAVNTRTRTRHWTYRGIVGVSMGGGGTGLVGLRNPERFDFVAPLGGPANWTHMMHYIQTYHLGGFCTADPDDEGDVGEHCGVPPPTEPFELTQEFENWYYPDGRDGQGGTFDREEYCQIFRDMSLAFGNPGMYNEESVYLPPGVPQEWWEKTPAERCAEPVVLEDFYDEEYNPDGSYQVITFCDGAEVPGDHGRWDPTGANDYPLDVGLAVDVDADTIRDPGEPVIRNGQEPYDDVGLDGVASALESGYDPVADPDPAGDDFHYQFNPGGTEGNWRWDGPAGADPGEPWADNGLDGVAGTPQQDEGGYDWGEGNDAFDVSPNFQVYLESDAYSLIRALPDAQLDRIQILGDGGIRDLFMFAAGEDTMMAALAERGRPVWFYNDFGSTWGVPYADELLDPKLTDFAALGRHTMIRYGNPDADEALLVRGDGGHVGTVTQVLNRLAYAVYAMSARWPGGDRERTATDTADTMLSFDFESPSTHRISPVSMILPPGYHTEAYADTTYPVIYFLHGYGQQPEDLIVSAIIFQNWMVFPSTPVELRLQKFIMVFPDGRCRSPDETPDHLKECIRGTFYADSVRPEGPQMETILLELMDYIDDHYRTRDAEDLPESY